MGSFWAELLNQRERWVLWAPAAVAAGVGAYFALHFEPPLWTGALLLGFLLASISLFYKNKVAVLVWLPFFLAALGFTAATVRTAVIAAPVLEYKTYPLDITGRVSQVEALPEGQYRAVFDQLQFNAEKGLPQDPMPERVRLKLKKGGLVPAAGDIVQVRAMLLPLSPPVLPGAYDFQRHAFFSGIGATGFTISDVTVVKPREGGFFFEHLRRYLRTHIQGAMQNDDAGAITLSLLTGEDRDLSRATYETIRAAGIAHLLAVSGMQVTMVTAFFFFVVRGFLSSIPYVVLRWPVKKITAFIAMLGAVFYMMLIGNSISAERAVIMMCVVMLAVMLDRDPFTLRVACFAATVLLLFQPESLFSPGFQLSFAAVVALIAFYESARNWWGHEDRGLLARLKLYVLMSLATTLVATLATTAFSLFHFLRAPLFPGLVANLIAVPLSSFVTIPAAITGAFLMPVGLEHFPLAVAEWSVRIIIQTAETVAAWPYAMYQSDAWPVWILAVVTLGGMWVCVWQKWVRWLGFIPIVAAILCVPLTPRADILISEGAKIFAVRGDDGRLWLSKEKSEKFVRDAWIEREAEDGHGFWDDDGAPLSCDKEACLYRRGGKLVSFVQDYMAMQRDCAEADIIISPLYIKPKLCTHPALVLDQRSFKYGGAHAIYIQDDGRMTLRSVGAERGQRPWAARRAPEFSKSYQLDKSAPAQ